MAVGELDPRTSGISVAAISKQRDVVFGVSQFMDEIAGLPELGRAAAHKGHHDLALPVHALVLARVEPDGGNVARLADECESFARIQCILECRQRCRRAVARSG